MEEYDEDRDFGSDDEDSETDINEISSRVNDYESVFDSVINLRTDEEILNRIDDDNVIYSKEGRPFVDYCDLTFTDEFIPQNTNTGEINYSNLPRDIKSLKDIFQLFITDELISLTVKYTNLHSLNEGDDFRTSEFDLLNFIGLLIYQGAHKDNQLPISNLWSKLNSKPFYYTTSSRREFEKHLKHIRFDDKLERQVDESGRNVDKLVPVRQMIDLFKPTLKKYFIPSKELTIDETVSKFNGRSPIRVYAGALKPNPYGFLFRSLCDANNIYILNFELYGGKNPNHDSSVLNLMHRLIEGADLSNQGIVSFKHLNFFIKLIILLNKINYLF